MKKIGEYTVRGKLTETEAETSNGFKIHLFDGRFDTGFRIVSFDIFPSTWSSSTTPDCIGKLGTESGLVDGAVNFMNADDNREIAWAGNNGGLDTGGQTFSIVDPDNMIIEDLFIYVRGSQDAADVNYMVKLEKYDITDWQGALSMVRNKSQG